MSEQGNNAMEKAKELERWLEERHDQWWEVHGNGCGLSSCNDGTFLNAARGHILQIRRDLERLCVENGLDLPPIAFASVPPPVPEDYSAMREHFSEHRDIEYECVADREKPRQLCLF